MADRKQGAGWSSGSSAAGHKAHWAFKCHGLPEHCFWPCPSLYGHHVPILWWLLPAG